MRLPARSFLDARGVANAALREHLLRDVTRLLGRFRVDGDGPVLPGATDDVDTERVGEGAASKKEERCDCEDGGFHRFRSCSK